MNMESSHRSLSRGCITLTAALSCDQTPGIFTQTPSVFPLMCLCCSRLSHCIVYCCYDYFCYSLTYLSSNSLLLGLYAQRAWSKAGGSHRAPEGRRGGRGSPPTSLETRKDQRTRAQLLPMGEPQLSRIVCASFNRKQPYLTFQSGLFL